MVSGKLNLRNGFDFPGHLPLRGKLASFYPKLANLPGIPVLASLAEASLASLNLRNSLSPKS